MRKGENRIRKPHVDNSLLIIEFMIWIKSFCFDQEVNVLLCEVATSACVCKLFLLFFSSVEDVHTLKGEESVYLSDMF